MPLRVPWPAPVVWDHEDVLIAVLGAEHPKQILHMAGLLPGAMIVAQVAIVVAQIRAHQRKTIVDRVDVVVAPYIARAAPLEADEGHKPPRLVEAICSLDDFFPHPVCGDECVIANGAKVDRRDALAKVVHLLRRTAPVRILGMGVQVAPVDLLLWHHAVNPDGIADRL